METSSRADPLAGRKSLIEGVESMQKISTRKVCELAAEFDGVTTKDHFGSDAFCANGRIFVTVWHDKNRVTLMLNEEQQKDFLSRDGSEGFLPMENAWGRDAIGVDLASVDAGIFVEALQEAWVNSKNKRSPLRKKASAKKSTASKATANKAKTRKAAKKKTARKVARK
jgi:hypothetical protein